MYFNNIYFTTYKSKGNQKKYMQRFENYIPLSSEHEKSKNNLNLMKVRPWLTEIDCSIFTGR